jgi:5'-3' exonuclease
LRTALIDGDLWCYQAASANEYECQWSTWLWTLHSDFAACVAQFDAMIADLKEAAKADKVVVALTDSENWRKKVMPSYKAHRLKTRKPIVYRALREYAQEKYHTFMRPTLEGDDVLGILATCQMANVPGEKIIVSFDKDLKTIPGLHLRLDDESRTERVISVEEADRFHLLQTLAGDSSDGYPGCPGIGMVNAERLLDGGMALVAREKIISRGPRKGEKEVEWVAEQPATPWEIVVSAFRSKGLSEEVALQNARVARICRGSDYDFAKKEVKLWHPERSKSAVAA